MEVSGVVLRQIPCLSGAATDNRYYSLPSIGGAESQFSEKLRSVVFKPRKVRGITGNVFVDNGHLHYYYETPRCGSKKEKVKDKQKTEIKKRVKLLKELSKNLTMFSSMGFCLDAEAGLVGEVQSETISEASDIFLKQLEQLRAEEKELKKKRKEEKNRTKTMKMKAMMDSESSSSSSESSDSDCSEVIDMSWLGNKCEPVVQPVSIELVQPVVQRVAIAAFPGLANSNGSVTKEDILEGSILKAFEEGRCCSVDNAVVEASTSTQKRIEVCMGGKCKKSGGAALLEEFEKVMGVGGSVVGCKCMGKCREGPNVRILNQTDGLDDSVRTPANTLCLGVGLQDVDAIVSNFVGEDRKDLGLVSS